MQVLLIMSLFFIVYGIAGLLGYQHIPQKFKGYSWTKDYIRCQGITWLMLGLPLFAFYLILSLFFADTDISAGLIVLIVVVLAIPSIIFTINWEKKYEALLEKEKLQ